MNNKLILRTLASPFVTPYTDITKGSVLSHADVDNNFIYLKGEVIYSAVTTPNSIIFKKLNGNDFTISATTNDTYVTGGTMTGGTFLVLTRNDGNEIITNLNLGSPTYNQYVNVTASTPDNYIGVADPVIFSGYQTDVVYIITFTDTNITSATTINIDGQGVLDLFVPTENGLEGPVPSGLTPNTTYFMVYNGDSMQVFDTDPTSNPLTYTSPIPIVNAIGGILPGMTFSAATMQQMWDTLLYPYLNPSISSFSIASQSTGLEIGDSIIGGARTFNWSTLYTGNIKPNTFVIKNLNTGVIISTPASGMTNDGTEIITIPSVTRTSAGSQSWQIYAKSKKNVTIARNFSVTWYNRIYYGNSPLTTLTASDITGLTNTNLTTSSLGTYVFAGGDYKYICIPVALNNPTLFRDVSTNLSVAMAGVSDGYTILNNGYKVQQVIVTNAFGINITYDVYRSKNTLGGAINIIAS